MGGNGVAQFAYESPDLVKVLNAARKGNFKVRIPAKNGAIPAEVAAGLNQVFAANQRMAQELEELRRERRDLLQALEAFSSQYGTDSTLEKLREEIGRLALEAARRAAEIQEAVLRARGLAAQGNAEAVVEFVRQSVAHVQQDAEIRGLLADAEKRLAERRAALQQALAAANALSAQERFDEALQALDKIAADGFHHV